MPIVDEISIASVFVLFGVVVTALAGFAAVKVQTVSARMTIAGISLVGALIAGFAGFWASHEQAVSERLAIDQRERIAALTAQIVEQSKQIARMDEVIFKSVTGHGGYIHLSGTTSSYPCHGGVVFTNTSKYPLYDVKVDILDMHEFREGNYEEYRQELVIGDLAAGQGYVLDEPLIRYCDENGNPRTTTKLNLIYTARNGRFFQRYRVDYRRLPTQMASAVWLNGFPVFSDISEGFPRLGDGTPDWDFEKSIE